ncbi:MULTISPECIES: hypothetical protein [Enterococcus]|uniref:DUF5648 domain-containing protein n=1 Tax=Enterococcus sulfureus ATCC 49903 TaxID=1140003 RepID=S0L893_9ENTE|nr:hypothetical protein [Enterococcus sulfureus]EOT48563.1 hypothetical protein OMY_00518 [Enterococcus sulfureus ATCC 49903]EOT87455.1 hypothetical protein I573_00511 [Enterococcus sulfureus ATCC 49903]
MKKWVLGLSILAGLCISTQVLADESVAMKRVYNPNSGEHFYTANDTEFLQLLRLGWKNEGIGWYAPTQGTPVYRLYNPNNGDHHYTLNGAEKNMLVNVGWRYEGIGWNSDNAKQVPLYRVYNPNNKGAGSHHYTTRAGERQQLVNVGWKNEGIGWYGVQPSIPVKDQQTQSILNQIQGTYYADGKNTPAFTINDDYYINRTTNTKFLITKITTESLGNATRYMISWDIDAYTYMYNQIPIGAQQFVYDSYNGVEGTGLTSFNNVIYLRK